MKVFKYSRQVKLVACFVMGCLFGLACADEEGDVAESTHKTGMMEQQLDMGTYFTMVVEDSCESPCTFRVKTDFPVAKIKYEADGFLLGSSTDVDQHFEITYDFSTLGMRQIIASGYADDETLLTKADIVIEVRANPNSEINQDPSSQNTGLALDVPYFYQYSNYYSPRASCQNTSIAMVLKYLGLDIVPDDITERFGKDYAQTPNGLAEIFNRYLNENGMNYRLTPHTQGSIQGLKEALDQGFPVIIHGYFTRSGHVVVVTGYDANGYYVNDPAGRWDQEFKGGYYGEQSDSIGKNIYYTKSAFESAVATSNGYHYLPLWFHTLKAN